MTLLPGSRPHSMGSKRIPAGWASRMTDFDRSLSHLDWWGYLFRAPPRRGPYEPRKFESHPRWPAIFISPHIIQPTLVPRFRGSLAATPAHSAGNAAHGTTRFLAAFCHPNSTNL